MALVSQMAALGLLMAWLLLNEAGHAWSRTGVRQVNVSKPSMEWSGARNAVMVQTFHGSNLPWLCNGANLPQIKFTAQHAFQSVVVVVDQVSRLEISAAWSAKPWRKSVAATVAFSPK